VDTAGTESVYTTPVEAIVPVAPLSVATTALPASVVGAAYSFNLSGVGGNPPYIWAGSGVPGLTVNSDGLISGTLTQSGTFVLSLSVSDASGETAVAALPVTVTAPAPPPPPTFPSGLVLYWPLDAPDTAGGVATDLSGNSNSGVIIGNPLSVPGQTKQALNFANAGGYVAGTQYTGVLTTSLTLGAWINTTNTFAFQTIFSKYSSNGLGAGYIFTINETGTLTVFIGASDILSLSSLVTDGTLVADGHWHHVAAVISFEAQTVQIYVDGKLTSSTPMNMAAGGDGGAILQAGATTLGYLPNYFSGSMDDVQAYSRALSSAEINTVFVLTGGVAQ
jgi:hypothetical protein